MLRTGMGKKVNRVMSRTKTKSIGERARSRGLRSAEQRLLLCVAACSALLAFGCSTEVGGESASIEKFAEEMSRCHQDSGSTGNGVVLFYDAGYDRTKPYDVFCTDDDVFQEVQKPGVPNGAVRGDYSIRQSCRQLNSPSRVSMMQSPSTLR